MKQTRNGRSEKAGFKMWWCEWMDACVPAVQVSTRERDYVVDTIALRSSLRDALAKHFLDASKLKVFHGADMDVQWLQRDFGIYIVGRD